MRPDTEFVELPIPHTKITIEDANILIQEVDRRLRPRWGNVIETILSGAWSFNGKHIDAELAKYINKTVLEVMDDYGIYGQAKECRLSDELQSFLSEFTIEDSQ